MSDKCVFCQICRNEIVAKIIYRDQLCIAFTDAMPRAPKHLLVIPIRHISGMSAITDEDKQLLGHIMIVASKLAKEQGLKDGYRVVTNDGINGRQTVFHLHFHVIGGRLLTEHFV